MIESTNGTGIDLFWLPLGAGGWFVRFNGRLYERVKAASERRPRRDLYHTALGVSLPEGDFVIENAWPIPDGNGRSRGVTVEGPVGSRRLGRFRVFRYEVRRWPGGVIADMGYAVASPIRVSHDQEQARRLLSLTEEVPNHIWGRDELGTGDMWNSNSVISWLLTRAGIDAGALRPPVNGRVPGWATGITAADTRVIRDGADAASVGWSRPIRT